MALDSMNESTLFQLEQYFNSNPYREYAMSKPYIPKRNPNSARSHRLNNQNQSSSDAFNQLINNQKNSLKLDRFTYKLRMKSDLNVNTLRETPIRDRRHNHRNSNINNTLSIPPSARTKTLTREPTSITMKTTINDELNGIEGNSIHVGTINDLIKQYHHAEYRLIRQPTESFDNTSTSISNNRLINERTISKSSPLPSERIIKQPQALTEYHFDGPTLTRTPSLAYRRRIKENKTNIDYPLLTDQYHQRLNSFEQQTTVMSSHDKRIQESREKILSRTEKQVCICNKLNIIDPFNSEQNDSILSLSQQPANSYIFPPIRPFGYFTKKSTDDIQRLSPLPIKKKHEIQKIQQKIPKDLIDSPDRIPTDEDEYSHLFNDINNSMVSLTELDDDLQNPLNTKVNFDLKQDKH